MCITTKMTYTAGLQAHPLPVPSAGWNQLHRGESSPLGDQEAVGRDAHPTELLPSLTGSGNKPCAMSE